LGLAESFFGAVDVVSDDRSTAMLRWEGLNGLIKIRVNVVGYIMAMLGLH
jgi:hypothetical protein